MRAFGAYCVSDWQKGLHMAIAEEQQEHYSTVLMDEKRVAMAAVTLKLADMRKIAVGDGVGYRAKKEEAA